MYANPALSCYMLLLNALQSQNFVMGIATVFLGLAPNYWLAVAARCLGGLSNGSGVAIKTMLAESCDANTQAKGMAYLNLGWGLGNICGKCADLHVCL